MNETLAGTVFCEATVLWHYSLGWSRLCHCALPFAPMLPYYDFLASTIRHGRWMVSFWGVVPGSILWCNTMDPWQELVCEAAMFLSVSFACWNWWQILFFGEIALLLGTRARSACDFLSKFLLCYCSAGVLASLLILLCAVFSPVFLPSVVCIFWWFFYVRLSLQWVILFVAFSLQCFRNLFCCVLLMVVFHLWGCLFFSVFMCFSLVILWWCWR